jgi:hypothetical protein
VGGARDPVQMTGMRIIRSVHSVRLGDTEVSVVGQTGPVAARWKIDVDGREVVNEKLVRGRRLLEAPLPDGSFATVEVCCAPSGQATVSIRHDGRLLGHFTGTVA